MKTEDLTVAEIVLEGGESGKDADSYMRAYRQFLESYVEVLMIMLLPFRKRRLRICWQKPKMRCFYSKASP